MVRGNGENQFRQYAGQNVGNQNRLIVVSGFANQNANQNRNGNVVATLAEGNGNGNNGDLDEIEEVNANCILMANLQKASTSDEADESFGKHKALEFEINRLLRVVVSQDIMSIMQNPTFVETSDLQTELACTKEWF
nr:hypothetical protein [Tanacetum cinerariifolium]